MKVYNSLTKKKEDFIPAEAGRARIYTCGVTVYDHCHIGHARSLYIFDVIRRYFEYKGYRVSFVRNITDIDDKIINRAKELGIGWKDLAEKYISHYRKDLNNLGIRPADFEPKATENIEDMIDYIKRLIDKGYAYATGTGVYFKVRKFKNYGRLSGQKIDDIGVTARIKADENKKDPLDFALWKISGDDDPGWPSPWGRGRPGWHIECSVMSQKYLKTETLDIHGGGRDLIFPHHENEITQAEALSGKNFANYWIHHGLLSIEGQKMSKSLGNFVTVADVLDKYPADVLKLFYLQAHYSSAIDFSWKKMEEAKKAYQRLFSLKDKLENSSSKVGEDRGSEARPESVNFFCKKFKQAMDDDFNAPQALAVLFDLVGAANKVFDSGQEKKVFKLKHMLEVIKQISGVFCFDFGQKKPVAISEEEIKKKIELRLEFRRNKDYRQADKIRKELEDKGIMLEDAKNGTRWRRKL